MEVASEESEWSITMKSDQASLNLNVCIVKSLQDYLVFLNLNGSIASLKLEENIGFLFLFLS
jgi:hypothetical protein